MAARYIVTGQRLAIETAEPETFAAYEGDDLQEARRIAAVNAARGDGPQRLYMLREVASLAHVVTWSDQ